MNLPHLVLQHRPDDPVDVIVVDDGAVTATDPVRVVHVVLRMVERVRTAMAMLIVSAAALFREGLSLGERLTRSLHLAPIVRRTRLLLDCCLLLPCPELRVPLHPGVRMVPASMQSMVVMAVMGRIERAGARQVCQAAGDLRPRVRVLVTQ